MVNENNNNLLPKENYKKVEEVREIDSKYEIPSFEEFMKSYQEDEKTIDSYNLEVDSYGDIRVKGTYYGPGFWDDIKGVVKPVASVALVAASVFPPTAAIAAPVAYTVIGAGVTAHTVGEITDIKDLKEVGKDLLEIGMGARDGQELTESHDALLNQYARNRN
jgi:hypothetical protein